MVYQIMTLFVYKFIRQAKLCCNIALIMTLEFRNCFFEFCFAVVKKKSLHSITMEVSFGSGKYTKCWLLIQGLMVA